MKTLLHKKIDGHDIVIGLGSTKIDAPTTKKLVSDAIKKTSIYKDVNTTGANILIAQKQKSTKANDKLIVRLKEKHEIQRQAFAEKLTELGIKHLQYFEPRLGEKVISDDEYSEYKTLLEDSRNDGSLLTVDKKKIHNYKGKRYHLKNQSGKYSTHTVDKVGVNYPLNAILTLTESDAKAYSTQRREGDIAKMTQSEKDDQFKIRKEELVSRASMRIIELELDGESLAKAKSTAFAEYNSEIGPLKTKYAQS